MEVTLFDGQLPMGDGKNATMLFGQDFRVPECVLTDRKLILICKGVQILGDESVREISSHPVYFDRVLIGRIGSDRTELTLLPPVDAGIHRITIEVSPFPGYSLCDDFILERIQFISA